MLRTIPSVANPSQARILARIDKRGHMQTSEIDQENVVGTAFGQESCARFMRNYGLDPKFQLDTQPGDL